MIHSFFSFKADLNLNQEFGFAKLVGSHRGLEEEQVQIYDRRMTC